MADTEAPTSFRDPFYAGLAADVERREGLPTGLLHSIINYGEQSNANQVSEKGARTVAQIIPATRKAALDKYGIDAYLSPQNALEVAGKLLKESLDRNDGDPAAAIGEYHGGPDRANWGPRTQSYIDRVSAGLQSIKSSAMGADFAKWMAANPATPAAPAADTPAAPAAANPLDAGFAQWLAAKGKPAPAGVDAIPGQNGEMIPPPPPGEKDPQTLGEKLKAAGKIALDTTLGMVGPGPGGIGGPSVKSAAETAATLLTGLTTGAAGMVTGAAGGAADVIGSGKFGTPEGARQIEQASAQGADNFTYQPKSPAARDAVATIGSGLQQAIPVMPLTGEMSALGRAASAAAPAVDATARAGASAAQEGAAAVSAAGKALKDKAVAMTSQATQKLMGVPETDGGMVGVGAAETADALQRRTTAGNLPVPIDLTTGQATRNHNQLRFEGETAKGELGGPLRERAAEQNAQLGKNFEALIDGTGAEAPPSAAGGVGVETGRAVVDNGLVPAAARAKAKYRALYQQADKAGELEAPVNLAPLADYLNANRAGRTSAPIMQTIADELKVQGIGDGALADGSLSAGDATLKTAETIRKAVNKFVKDTDPNDVRVGVEIKQVIDQITEGLGGDLYKQARAARQRYAQLFENNAVVADLLRNRRGTADRQVALEDVFRRTILNGSREDLSMLRRTLQVAGGEEGHQAWRELQGATLRHMLDEATKGSASDVAGNTIFSEAKLNNAIRALDADGKLDFVLGKQRAQMVRDIHEISRWVKTVPPGALNTSNTASVILAAIAEAGATGGLTGLPVPVLSTLRLATKYARDRQIRQRVNQALGKAEASAKKVKAPASVVPPSQPSTQAPVSRTLH